MPLHPLARDSPIPIIPVIDLMGGKVVRAIRGDRANYRPWHSHVCPTADPLEAAANLTAMTGQRRLYVADLDAIAGDRTTNAEIVHRLAAKYDLLLDPGIRTAADAASLPELGNGQLVVGSETLADWETLAMLAEDRPNGVAFSFDLRGGRLMGSAREAISPGEAASRVSDSGVLDVIALELEQVGTASGPNSLIESVTGVRDALPRVELMAGGGIKILGDIRKLAELGCSASLIATALHDLR
ncbi:MAG: HisA/HisF-related TIM barrel protein [Planctomycetota bacterium]